MPFSTFYSPQNFFTKLLVGTVFFFILAGCQSKSTLFECLDATKTGIDFENRLTETEKDNILAYEYFYNGGGVAVADFNNDQRPDVYLTGNQVSNKLYLNKNGLTFEDVTAQAGVAGRSDGWKTGVTVADVNADGWLDIYVCYSGNVPAQQRKNQLFINNGVQGNGQESLVIGEGAVGKIENSKLKTQNSKLEQVPTFTEQAEAYGLADAGYSTQALFFDYDTDGDLDLFVLNHNLRDYQRKEAAYLKKEFDPNAGDRLYRNETPSRGAENSNVFTDVTASTGILSNALGFGLGVAVGDLNNDNLPDLYVCNDYVEEDYCYLNNGNGTFTESGKQLMGHFSYSTMGVDIADVNNDALPDIFTTDMLPETNARQKRLGWPDNWNVQQSMLKNGFHWQNMRNMLQINLSPHRKSPQTPERGLNKKASFGGLGAFAEIGQLAGVAATDWSWAGLLADFDNDGFKDLFVSNGFVRDYTDLDFVKYYADEQQKTTNSQTKKALLDHLKQMPATPTHHFAFKNNGDLTFDNKVKEWGFEKNTVACGAAYADFDNDGDLDLITNNTNEPACLYRNNQQAQNPHNYLKIKLNGGVQNRFGLGAKVYLYAGEQVQYQEFMPTRGFQSCMYDNLHFGMANTKTIDSVRVVWPDAKTQTLRNIAPNQLLTFRHADAPDALIPARQPAPWFSVSNNLIFAHHENPSVDFNRQILLPYLYSYGGPRLIKGDVNADQLEDLYIGGASGQAGQLFLQTKNQQFVASSQPDFETDKMAEDRDAAFFDADRDGDLDLYVLSGGYEFVDQFAPLLQDRLYLNDGKGHFARSMAALPALTTNKSCVQPFDTDQDGDLDLFVGGSVQPGNFPFADNSYLLKNDGKGHFSVAAQWSLGLVTDAAVADLNADKWAEIVVVAEWQPLQILTNKKGTLAPMRQENSAGWYNRIAAADLDNDGDLDFVTGNVGQNIPFKPTTEQPLTLYYDDFDHNGRVEPFVSFFVQNEEVPLAGRDEALEQWAALRKVFTDYQKYGKATMADVLGQEMTQTTPKLTITETRTGVWWNEKGTLNFKPLPIMAQAAPVFGIAISDFDNDGKLDILLAGNQSKFRIRIGKTDANAGVLLRGTGNQNFVQVPQNEAGLWLKGDVRDAVRVGNQLIFSTNDGPVQTYRMNERVVNQKQ
ncbi:MAG: RNA-binding protein [Runella slithyformis]|nr:MAG: RNA-binding protein [Runella slithyformis]